MGLNEKQVTMITDTVKELIGAGVDALANRVFPVGTEKQKTRRKNRQHRAKKTDKPNLIEV